MSNESERLSAWLHRIEEACAAGAPSKRERDVREAALAALRGESAPKGNGLPTMFRVGDRVVSITYENHGLVLARDGREVWVRFLDGRRLTLLADDLVLEDDEASA